jgi:hypothetical protein
MHHWSIEFKFSYVCFRKMFLSTDHFQLCTLSSELSPARIGHNLMYQREREQTDTIKHR